VIFLYTPHTISKDLYPVFLKREEILSVWDNDILCKYVQRWDGEPRKRWFKDSEQSCLIIGRASFENNALRFSNGRHRTRWLLQQGYKEIPILMNSQSIVEAVSAGMFSSKALDGMEIA
jgi:hypothetical protein